MTNAFIDILNWLESITDSFYKALLRTDAKTSVDIFKNVILFPTYLIQSIFHEQKQTYSVWLQNFTSQDFTFLLSAIVGVLCTILVFWFVKQIFNLFKGYLR